MLYIGDMFQLPPVAGDSEWNILSAYYRSPYYFDSRVVQEQPPVPPSYRQAIALLDPIPGIDVAGAETMLAELGTDMRQYPSAAHAASWTGLAPGNNESAGKQRGGTTPPAAVPFGGAASRTVAGISRRRGEPEDAPWEGREREEGRERIAVSIGDRSHH